MELDMTLSGEMECKVFIRLTKDTIAMVCPCKENGMEKTQRRTLGLKYKG
jgi:hypothetical protein